jgi:hypothetical protein
MSTLLAILLALSLPAERRAALLVGENAGDQADVPLRYAESDAAALREVLVRMGGVAEADATILRGANAPELRGALATLAERLQRQGWGKADRLLLYVSAHASAGELHLRGSRFPIAELRRFIDSSPAGVALLILDTCESGAAVRAKGLVPLSGPVVQVERAALTGRVVIASAGSEESAFESDELGGSLFTQHFIAGLRGAADSSHDGKVTLQEAYGYAYARTVESATAVRAARQTPIFDIDLQGEGELVLSEPSRGRAQLRLDIERPGEWVIASMDGGAQVARFVKGTGVAVFALDPGSYRLRSRVGDFYEEEVVHVADGAQAVVAEKDLSRWKLVPAGRKGGGSETRVVAGGALASGAVSGLGALVGFSLAVRHGVEWSGSGRPILVAAISGVFGRPGDGTFTEQEFAAVIGGGVEGRLGPVLVRGVIEAGALGVRQKGAQNAFGVQPRADAQLGVAWRVSGPWSVDLSIGGGGLLVKTAVNRHLQPFLVAQGGVGWGW